MRTKNFFLCYRNNGQPTQAQLAKKMEKLGEDYPHVRRNRADRRHAGNRGAFLTSQRHKCFRGPLADMPRKSVLRRQIMRAAMRGERT